MIKRKDLIRMLEDSSYRWARKGDHTTMYKPDVPKDQVPPRGLIKCRATKKSTK